PSNSILKAQNTSKEKNQVTQFSNSSLSSNLHVNKLWQEGGAFDGFTPEQELIEKRTQISKTFVNPDGSHTAVFCGLTHYLDENGIWQEADYSIKTNNNTKFSSYKYANTTANIKSYFPEKSGNSGVVITKDNLEFSWWKNPKIILRNTDGTIIYSADAVSSEGQISDNKITYNSYSGISDEFEILDDGLRIENNIIINYLNNSLTEKFEGASLEFTQFIPLDPNWQVISDNENKTGDFSAESFLIKPSGVENAIFFHPIVIFDSKLDKEKAINLLAAPEEKLSSEEKTFLKSSITKGTYKVQFVNGGINVLVTLPQSWLFNPDLTFPITIDPIVEINAAMGNYAMGSGTSCYGDPYNTYYHDCRLQSVYLASELTAAGIPSGSCITAVQLWCNQQPGRDLLNFYIRMQNTTSTTSTAWVTSGWTPCYYIANAGRPVLGVWTTYTFGTTHVWNGNNLLLDISRDGNAYTSGGGIVAKGLFAAFDRGCSAYHDSGYPWPFDGKPVNYTWKSVPALKITYNAPSTAPTSISATANPICPSASTTLSVVGGSLGTGASWMWYSGSCGGTYVGTGASIAVSPAVATTYYVRAESSCNTTGCASLTINMNTLSTAPASINATANPICPSGSTTLSVVGGSLGTGASWKWYSGSCGGTYVNTGASIAVSPAVATTYYVRAEGTCNTTGCASLTINMNTLSTAPTSINATANPICPSASTTLSVVGGSLGTGASWKWYTGSCGGTYVNTGASIVVSPAVATTYYVRAEGTCNTTGCASLTINMNTLSTAPTSINATANPICSGNSSTLSVVGGSLGTGASWKWYSGSCGGTYVNTGASIAVSPASTTTYYVRAEGTCNTTGCASLTITVNTAPSITSQPTDQTICDGANTSFSVTATGAGLSYQWQEFISSWNNLSNGGVFSNVTTATMNITGATSGMSGRSYRCIVSGACSPAATSSFAVLTINANPSITSQPTNQTACENGSAVFSVFASGSSLSYQWQVNTGSGWNNITSAGSNPTYSDWTTSLLGLSGIILGNNGYQYRCYLTTSCSGSVTSDAAVLTVNTLSVAPASINATVNPICSGNSTTLSVVGGSLGTGAVWKWYSGSCGGAPEGTGTSIIVSPVSTTAYYVRAEGTCNTTGCASLTITINTLSSAASSINITTNPICSGGSTTLSVSGGSLGTGASWKWYTGSCGGTYVNSGASIIVSPATTTIYYVRAEGTCNTTGCINSTVTVNAPSSAPTGASAAPSSIVAGNSSTLSVIGGSLGTGASWYWYSGSCGGTFEGTGSSIIVSPTTTTTYYVRAEGGAPCSPTSCASVTVTVSSNSPIGVYLAGAKIWIESGAYVWIDGDASGNFTDASGGGVDGEIRLDGNFKLEGDWTNNSNGNALYTVTINGTVEFAGTTFQTIAGSHLTTFENLLINNSNADPNNVIIEDNSYNYFNTIMGILTLTDGALNLNHNTLIVENSAAGSITAASGYIVSESEDSKLQWNIGTATGNHIFPFGRYLTVLRNIPFSFDITGSGTGSGSVTLSTYHTGSDNTPYPATVTNLNGNGGNNSLNVLDRFWIITPAGYTVNPTATLTFNYEYVSSSDNEFYSPNTIPIEADLQAQRWDGTIWVNPPVGADNNTSHYVQVPNVSTFSPWVLVKQQTPLPVELLDFSAVCVDQQVNLSWTTASELNCDRFDIEKSKDLLNWYFVGIMPGTGTTNELQEYSYIDNSPYSGISYYTLKQFDYDGASETYGPVSTECIDAQSSTFEIINILPNETNDEMTITYNVFEDCKIQAYMIDALGQQLSAKKDNATAGLNMMTLPLRHSLCIGIYMVTIEYNDKIFTQKIFIH
ncbi:MAG: T9SS type A sorting domain-containing protein, partial [Bacteroidota bacterium]